MQKLQFWLGEDVEGFSHTGMHFDEILACFLINNYGDLEFARKYLEGGKLVLGVNNGHFDEHRLGGRRKGEDDECCATLAAKALKVENDPAIKKLLRYVRRVDIKGHGQPKEVHNIIKLLHQQNVKPSNVFEWAILAISAKHGTEVTGDFTLKGVFMDMRNKCKDVEGLKEAAKWYKMGVNAFKADQEAFATTTKEEYWKRVVAKRINSYAGSLTMVIIDGLDDPRISKFARSKEGHEADVVVQRTKRGNVQIYTDKRKRLNMDDVVSILRYEEQKARNEFITKDFKKLCADGKVHPTKDVWFYLRKGGMLLNGSLTAPDVPATKLCIEEIIEAIKTGLDISFKFESCKKRRRCIAKYKKDECSWYPWGLHRCRTIRFEMKNKS